MYAEENLESSNKGSETLLKSEETTNKETAEEGSDENLSKMLQMANIKVNETELSKQSSDIEQIVANRIYDEKRNRVEQMEKNLRKQIEKSREYFELKAAMYKELRFLFTKIEGLKACLKEAKLAYQQSLKNLELISTEIHSQRQQNQQLVSKSAQNDQATGEKLVSNSLSTLSSTSSISSHDQKYIF